ncbi:hypothetical protein CPB86DRAFT_706057 [Serendipita vermifera]|nr:hypothetical protein CPB86DRAFT_706057 [Serendipita vermifera]
MLPDNYIPPLDADGGFSLPPPHELNGSAMQSAINLTLSQNPSRNPSRNPSPTPGAQPPRSAQRSRDPSPLGRLGGSIKHAASAVIHNMPSLTKARDQSRGRSRSPGHSQSQSPSRIEEARARARSRSRSRPRSTEGFNETYSDGQQNLLRPEDIYIAPSTASDNGSFRGRDPGRRYTGMSQNSPISQRSILDMNGGALGLTRGGDARDIGFVTYPNASTANLSMIEEERARHSGYNPSPSPNMRTTTEHHLPPPTADYYQPRPSGSQRQFSDGSINRRDTQDIREGWDTSSRYPPPPPSMKSPTSTIDYPPTGPAKSATSASHPYPWSNRPVPSKITMPALLGPQSPATSSKAGFAGIGAGANYHRRAASVVVPGERNFASPHPSVRLSMAGSIAGSESGRPPIAPKPQPPSRRSKIVNSINLDDPPGEGTPYQNPGHVATRSWSGEQRQIGRTIPTKSHGNTAMRPEFTGSQPLVTVEEKSPYLQGPSARGSTGSLNSVHSNRLKFDPKEYVDPAYLVPTDLTAVLEKQIGQPPPPSNEGPATSVVTKAGKRVSKVLRLGKKNK